ncbi:hypothetical protein [Dyella sedimenti]|uniref:hypothetical protein n=1 Tax=Dyella sedimenti TaxID=2919947 RepID=UPI001FAA04E6|nr:hypothetical protein [Dyella sedimenti]
MRRVLTTFVMLASLSLGGCATDQRNDSLTNTLNAYAGAVRWGDFQSALQFVDPQVRAAHPLSPLELSRYQQYKVSGYDEGNGPVPHGQDEVSQVVQINLVNVNTQSERTITDHQTWRYDAQSKHWWLTSGLPDISRQ